MRADMEVAGLLAMLMLPAVEVCGAEEDNTSSAVPHCHAPSPVSLWGAEGPHQRQIEMEERRINRRMSIILNKSSFTL